MRKTSNPYNLPGNYKQSCEGSGTTEKGEKVSCTRDLSTRLSFIIDV